MSSLENNGGALAIDEGCPSFILLLIRPFLLFVDVFKFIDMLERLGLTLGDLEEDNWGSLFLLFLIILCRCLCHSYKHFLLLLIIFIFHPISSPESANDWDGDDEDGEGEGEGEGEEEWEEEDSEFGYSSSFLFHPSLFFCPPFLPLSFPP